jgi:hypothetical protein
MANGRPTGFCSGNLQSFSATLAADSGPGILECLQPPSSAPEQVLGKPLQRIVTRPEAIDKWSGGTRWAAAAGVSEASPDNPEVGPLRGFSHSVGWRSWLPDEPGRPRSAAPATYLAEARRGRPGVS